MFSKVLIPLDGSSIAEEAVGVAASIARAANAGLDVVLVDQPFPFDNFGKEPWAAAVVDEEREYLATIADQIAAGTAVPVTHEVLRGDPVEKICQRVDDAHADLVVMTSHGRTGFGRMWLGSVADGVLRFATAPVLMMRGVDGGARAIPETAPFTHLLVPIDGSAWSAEVLDSAAALAECAHARVTLLRVVQTVTRPAEAPVPFSYMPTIVDEAETSRRTVDARTQIAEQARQLHDTTGVSVDWHVAVAQQVATGILEFARANDVDAIAMSTHGRGMSRSLIGSIADKVLRASGLPMLLYRPLAARAKARIAEHASAFTHA